MLPRLKLGILSVLLLLWQGLPSPVFGQAAQLAPGEQCFSAGTSTSGGTVGVITTLGAITGGSGYNSAGTYTNVPLTGGSGQGALGTVTVSGGAVTAVTVSNPGFHYAASDVLSAANSNLGGSGSGFQVSVTAITGTGTGMIGVLGTITGGTGGTAGSYPNVSLTGGTGSGATANITVAGGAVTVVAVLNPGIGYAVGDSLSATSGNIGNVSGFSVPVNAISVNSQLAGGTVDYYIPATNSRKQTWADSAQTILNANPVPLDANGCATVYGTGTYRQVVKDSLGNIIWDKLTTAPGAANNVFWAGTAGGTANAITVVDPGFAGVDGSIINFLPLANNTSSVTLNPSNYFGGSPAAIVKDTTAGPVALTGGEINATNGGLPTVISVIYSATQNNFHLLNAAIASASGATAPLCGAVGLKITNGSTKNSIIAVTADQAVMQTPSGLTINRSTVSVNINITLGNSASIANGMDGEAPGTSAWIQVFLIDNGAAAAGLGTLAAGNGVSPTMPSGYTYKCRVGAMRVDGSGNLYRTTQLGSEAQWTPDNSTNNTTYPSLGITNVGATMTTPQGTIAVAAFVPPTATRMRGSLGVNGAAGVGCIGPNNSAGINWANCASSTSGVPFGLTTVANDVTEELFDFLLEGTSLYFNANAAVVGLALGWKDKVNAN